MIKRISWLITFFCVLAFNPVAFSNPSLCQKLETMVQSLNLDEAQKAKIKPILAQLKTDAKAAADQMDGISSQISEQVNSAQMDQTKVNALVDKQASLIGDVMKAKIKAKNQIFSVLKPDQKTTLQNMVKKVEEKIANEFKKCD